MSEKREAMAGVTGKANGEADMKPKMNSNVYGIFERQV